MYFTIHEIKMKEPGVMGAGIVDATPRLTSLTALTVLTETH